EKFADARRAYRHRGILSPTPLTQIPPLPNPKPPLAQLPPPPKPSNPTFKRLTLLKWPTVERKNFVSTATRNFEIGGPNHSPTCLYSY
ncbi:hypothetical protein A2U01_0041884, partial [Trifolium medium]|nr:hypothetical protein [Trifolium medium]